MKRSSRRGNTQSRELNCRTLGFREIIHVCERNFNKADIVRYDAFLIDGETACLQRKLPKLQKNAMPLKFREVPGVPNESEKKRPF